MLTCVCSRAYEMHQMQVPAWPGELVSSGGSDMEAKLHLSNLNLDVSNEDIKVFFFFLIWC